MSVHWTRSDDRGGGECLADSNLTDGLGTIELGCRGRRSVEVRYVDQPRNANARGDLGNALSTFHVYVVIGEISFVKEITQVSVALARKNGCDGRNGKRDVLGLIITANEIVHNIRVPNAFCDLFFVADLPFLPSKHD